MRGTEKRVIYLKNPESHLFEGAFFLLKDAQSRPPVSESDIVKEATRILYEGEAGKQILPGKPERGERVFRLLFFFLGFALCALGAVLLSVAI